MVLSLLAEPDDPVTGGLPRRVGAVETLRLRDTNTTVPGLGRGDGQVWRDCLTSHGRLDDLGDRAPYVLFVQGTTSFLARPLNDLVTVTESRSVSAYGEYVAGEPSGDLVNRERVLVAHLVSRLLCTV